MLIPDKWLLLIGTMAYVAALILTLVRLSDRRAPMHGFNLVLILCGWLMQTTGLWILGVEAGSCPIRNPFEVLQFISWSIIIIYLFTGQVFRLSLFGTGSASLAAIVGFLAFLIPGATHIPENYYIGGDPRINAHASLALFSYGIFGLLAVISVLYLMQNNSLKTKRNAGIFRFLPSLMDMDTVLMRLLIVACIVYTISIAIGALYWFSNLSEISLAKLILTVALWVVYLVVMVLRATNKLYGTRLARALILLFVAALLILWPVEASRSHTHPLPEVTSETLPPDNAD
ncbi:MAG: inner membrane protein YpjD [Puniceicoccaceae bacterium]